MDVPNHDIYCLDLPSDQISSSTSFSSKSVNGKGGSYSFSGESKLLKLSKGVAEGASISSIV